MATYTNLWRSLVVVYSWVVGCRVPVADFPSCFSRGTKLVNRGRTFGYYYHIAYTPNVLTSLAIIFKKAATTAVSCTNTTRSAKMYDSHYNTRTSSPPPPGEHNNGQQRSIYILIILWTIPLTSTRCCLPGILPRRSSMCALLFFWRPSGETKCLPSTDTLWVLTMCNDHRLRHMYPTSRIITSTFTPVRTHILITNKTSRAAVVTAEKTDHSSSWLACGTSSSTSSTPWRGWSKQRAACMPTTRPSSTC